VVEEPVVPTEGACSAGELRSLADGRRFPLLQDLGPSAQACRLDAAGVVTACAAVQQAIGAGCDLVVLNKFGKIEESGGGLAPAFASAVEAGAPILTSVSPKFTAAWDGFAAALYVILPPDLAAIERWWASVRGHVDAQVAP
jgi:hypothetical protein